MKYIQPLVSKYLSEHLELFALGLSVSDAGLVRGSFELVFPGCSSDRALGTGRGFRGDKTSMAPGAPCESLVSIKTHK